jgi:hypothetical protein
MGAPIGTYLLNLVRVKTKLRKLSISSDDLLS